MALLERLAHGETLGKAVGEGARMTKAFPQAAPLGTAPPGLRWQNACSGAARPPILAAIVLLLVHLAAPRAENPAAEGTKATPAVSAAPLPRVRVASDGRTFETAAGQPFVPLGVNYFRPGTGWAPQLWKQFDAEAIGQDLRRMRPMGVNCVRVFLSYGSFFNQEDRLDAGGLAKLDRFLEMAEAAGIYVHPTGPDHWEGVPAWASGDRLADDRILSALETFWKHLAARYRGRGVIFAYDLLNEPAVRWDTPTMRAKWNQYLAKRYGSAERAAAAWGVKTEEIPWGRVPPPEPKAAPGSRRLLDYQLFREEIADAWTRRQALAIKSADPHALVTVGLIQWSVPVVLPAVQHYAGFRPARQAPWLDFLEVHFYPLARGFYAYQNQEEELRNLAYLESVVREVAKPGKPVVLAEFGWYGGGQLTIDRGSHPPASEQQQARWCRLAVETTAGLATGWLNWGLYDHPEARDVTQLTGLWTAGGRPKAWAREFQALANKLAHVRLRPPQLGPRPDLDWDRAITDPAATERFREDYLRAFRSQWPMILSGREKTR